jgi:hypothetical protein
MKNTTSHFKITLIGMFEDQKMESWLFYCKMVALSKAMGIYTVLMLPALA